MENRHVLIIGGGVAGLSAALDLARFNIHTVVVEKSDFPGGHGIQFSCKASDRCVKCGACVVEEKLQQALDHPKIRLINGGRIDRMQRNGRFNYQIHCKPQYIDPQKCTNCGECKEVCPSTNAIRRGTSAHHSPFFAIQESACRYMKDKSCTACRDTCPESAIDLDGEPTTVSGEADAVVVATGFKAFDPGEKPYGYKMFPDVVTNLELERMLRQQGRVIRPSTGAAPGSIAFVQCVGSRDAKLKHLWCSKVCCASALRMALRIRRQQPETVISLFYIDIQTFGKDFETFYREARENLRFIRAIPGDIVQNDHQNLQVTFFNNEERRSEDAVFDLVVLSVGMQPCDNSDPLPESLSLIPGESGFALPAHGEAGVFTAGTVEGPMGIAESIASAGETAWQVHNYLNNTPPLSGSDSRD